MFLYIYTFGGWFDRAHSEFTQDTLNKMKYGTSIIVSAKWTVNEYTVTFDSNGGEGVMEPQTMKYGETNYLNGNTFKRETMYFAGWATTRELANNIQDDYSINYDDIVYQNNSEYTMGESGQTLYAIWLTFVYEFDDINKTAKVVSIGGMWRDNYIIPATIARNFDGVPTDYTVTGIGDNVFLYASTVTIPITVTSIRAWAFNRGVTIILEEASQPSGWNLDWDKLEVILAKNNITTDVEYDYVVKNNEVYLTKYKAADAEIIIPNQIDGMNVVFIGNLFYNDTLISSIEIPSTIRTIVDYAFYDCVRLANITVAGDNANYSSENGVLFNKDMTEILYYPEGKTDTSYEIPASVKKIGYGAFKNSRLESIVVPASVTSIGDSAFAYCSSLTSITFAEGSQLISIGDNAFYGCSSLTSIEIPAGVTRIGYKAFYLCSSLTIYAEVANKPSGWTSDWNYSNRPVYWLGE